LVAALMAGCTTTPTAKFDTVGPMPGAYGPFGVQKGYLQVFSETRPVSDDGIMYYPHTPFSVYAPDGKKATSCVNAAGPYDQVPLIVTLEPGSYEVYARAAGIGTVQVPVAIVRNRITVVFLEHSGMPKLEQALVGERPVVLAPDGRIIGPKYSPSEH
jgi:hypothetical protein